jgi:predicted metal-binding protein
VVASDDMVMSMDDFRTISGRIEPVDPQRSRTVLAADAETYARDAVALGADVAHTLEAARIHVDDRVVFKCAVPKCFGYNTCANCPPHAPTPDEIRRLLSQFGWAVVFGLDMRPQALVRDRETIGEHVSAYQKVFHIVSALESKAFYDGHYLSVGFAAGSCKSTFCHNVPCAVLAGDKCRHNLIARPSMEAVGIDCYALAAELGWVIFPVGSSAEAGQVGSGLLMGAVLIG